MFQQARSFIKEDVEKIKARLEKYKQYKKLQDRTLFEILGYSYQSQEKLKKTGGVPKRFIESIPNDVTFGYILRDGKVSYELLRKTLILLRFYDFYVDISDSGEQLARYDIYDNLIDFEEEVNGKLDSCGFSQIYLCHPFDCLIMYCANSHEPLEALHLVLEAARR